MPILKPQINGKYLKKRKKRQPAKIQLKEYYNRTKAEWGPGFYI